MENSDDKPGDKPADENQQQRNNNNDQQKQDKQEGDTPRKRPGKKPLIILAIVVIVMLVVALFYWLFTRNEETTDDAFTDGDAVTVAAKTSGYVIKLLVTDNQRVRKGDLLLVIDPRDNEAKRDQARAQLGLAEAQLHQAQAQLALARVQYPAQRDQALAQQTRAQADLMNAQADISVSVASIRGQPRSKILIMPVHNNVPPKHSCKAQKRKSAGRSRLAGIFANPPAGNQCGSTAASGRSGARPA